MWGGVGVEDFAGVAAGERVTFFFTVFCLGNLSSLHFFVFIYIL